MNRTLLPAAAAMILLASACATFKGTPETAGETITVETATPFVNENVPAAHAIVTAQARNNAVSQVLPAFIPTEDTPESAAFKAKVLAAPEQYIKKERVVRERVDRKTYRLKLRTVIPLENLDRTYHDMFPPAHNGRTSAVLLSYEKLNGSRISASYGRQAAAKQLKTLPCAVTELDTPVQNDSQSVQQQGISAAMGTGASFAAVITAQAAKIDMPQLSLELTAVKASVKIQFIATQTGAVLAESYKEATSVDKSEQAAAQKAISSASDKAAAEILTQAGRAVKEKFRLITLRVTDIASYEQLRRLRDSLYNTPNVNDFRLVSFTGGKATYSVESDGIAGEELAATILRQNQVPLVVSFQSESEVEFKAN